jgi:Flp pilus assembly protein TadD
MTAESRLRVADAAEEAGDRDMAASMYAAAAKDAPNDTPTLVRCAEGLARNGRLDDAAELLVHRQKAVPKDTEVLRTIGAIEVMAGQPSQAILTLSAVLAFDPTDVKAMADKAVALDVLRRHAEAQVLYRQALTQGPSDPAICNDLALSLLLSGQPEQARDVLAQFRGRQGLPERMSVNLGIMDAASGHTDEAQMLLGSRIAAADLAALTQAIGRVSGSVTGRP